MIRAEHEFECPDCHSHVRATCEVNQDLLEMLLSAKAALEEGQDQEIFDVEDLLTDIRAALAKAGAK